MERFVVVNGGGNVRVLLYPWYFRCVGPERGSVCCLHTVSLVGRHVGSLRSEADVVGVGARSSVAGGGRHDTRPRGDHQLWLA